MLEAGYWMMDTGFGGNYIVFYYPASSIQYHGLVEVKLRYVLDIEKLN